MPGAVLEIHQLQKSFGGVRAVHGCSFEVEAHKITALVGPNGAGKTTVFNVVSGLLPADGGAIRFCGEDITRRPAWRRARLGLSRTFQLSRLLRNLSVEDNLLLALRQDDDLFWRMLWRGAREHGSEREKIREAMAQVVLDKDPATLVTELSYGQQKLFDLARALVHPHTFLMLDEPVAGINPVLREQLKGILKGLAEKQETILLIEHDMDFVRGVADHVIVMDQGKVLAQGLPAKVLSDKKVLEAYLGFAD